MVHHVLFDGALWFFRRDDGGVLSRMVGAQKRTAIEICNDQMQKMADAKAARMATAKEYLAAHPALVEDLRAWRELFPGMRLLRVGPK